MYRAYWGMEFNPFDKEIPEKQFHHGTDYNEMMRRLEYLKNVRGAGLSKAGQLVSSSPHFFIPESVLGSKFRSLYSGMKTEELLLVLWDINIRICSCCGCEGAASHKAHLCREELKPFN